LGEDALGSVRLVTDEAGAVVSRHDYLPFGEEIPAGQYGRYTALGYGNDDELTHRFTGKERDEESGLDYFGARYYSGAMGRFTGADRPFADQHIADPQSWNLYTYVRDNPLRYLDVDGSRIGRANPKDKFSRNAMIEIVRRPTGRTLFQRLAALDAAVVLRKADLNAPLVLLNVRENKGGKPTFGTTAVSRAPSDPHVVNLDATAIQQVGARAGVGTQGVVTGSHELKHVDDYVTGGAQAYFAGDQPSSQSGPAEQFGRQVDGEKPDIEAQQAGAIVDAAFAHVTQDEAAAAEERMRQEKADEERERKKKP
jgi:RHS repeat-associated protein